jgi:WD40 repeat protein/serine/threonine protein kinase
MAESSSDVNPLDALAEEFVARHRAGERPALAEFIARRPDLEKDIRDLFPALVLMEGVRPVQGEATGEFDGARDGEGGKPLRRLGDYRILREVGRGGMGLVYEAEQESLGRHVALKVLPAHALLDPQRLRRFQREAKAAARLHHTNIVPVYGVGEADGLHYYVMQFIQGQGLDQVLVELRKLRRAKSAPAPPRADDGPAAEAARSLLTGCFPKTGSAPPPGEADAAAPTLPETAPPASDGSSTIHLPGQPEHATLSETGRSYWQSVARIGVQVADALAYAHAQGTLHRDVKPSNLLLDTAGTVWVADFGLAKAADAEDLTDAGDIIGTIRYMAPERFQGKCDARSDVYGLGLTLYELLALCPAFNESDRNILIGLVTGETPPPPRQHNPTVPRDLETIVLKAIARDPAQRYATAADLAADLRRFIEDRPIRARRVGPVEQLWRWGRRNPTLATMIGAVVAVTALGFGGVLWQWGRAQQARDEATAQAAAEATAHRDAQDARRAAEATLCDMYTAYGLVAGEHNDPGQAVLWFANSARLAGAGTERESVNRVRVAAWGRQAYRPLRALEHADQAVQDLTFHPGGRYLLARTLPAGAEWPHVTLWDLAGEASAPLPGTSGTAAAAAWDTDGGVLAVAGAEDGATLYRFPSGEVRRRVEHPGPVRLLSFSADGRFLAMAGEGGTRVWDCQADAFATPLLPHPAPVTALCFHPDGRRLATACRDQRARVFAVPGDAARPLFQPVRHIQHEDPTLGVRPVPLTFVDAGRGLLVAAEPRALTWIDAETGARLRDVRLRSENEEFDIHTAASSPDGRYFAVAGGGRAQIWDAAKAETTSPLLEHNKAQHVVSAAFSPDGRTLVTGAGDHTVRRWAVPGGKPLGGPLVHPTSVHLCRVSPDGRCVATAQRGGLVRLWEMPAADPRDFRAPLDGRDSRAAFSRDGRYVMPTGLTFRTCELRSTRVYDIAAARPAGPPLENQGIILDAAFAPDGRRAAALCSTAASAKQRASFFGRGPGKVVLWEWRTGKPTGDPIPLPSEPRGLDYSPDGDRLAVLCAGGQLALIDPAAGRVVAQWQAHDACWSEGWYVNNGAVRFSPDGRSLLTFGTDTSVRVWDADAGRERYTLKHEQLCHDVRFSPDGRFLATASWDDSVRVWDAATGRAVGDPLPHPDWVFTARFSPDGNQLVTACRDGAARLWDWRSGRLSCPPLEHQDEVFAAEFTPDGCWVATASLDRTARVWEARTGKPAAPALALDDRALSVAVASDGRYAAVGGFGHTLAVFHLGDLHPPEDGDLDDLCSWGELLSGRRLQDGGGVANLTAAEWLQRWRAFRNRHPDYGTIPAAEARK